MKSKSKSTGKKAMDAQPIVCHVVSHTHWDRAWYLPFEKFRLRLIDVLDELLEVLATDKEFKHFVFDGQITPIEDYLAVRSEKRGLVEKMAREGKLVLGPHYILPDEFLVSGESLVRNLLVGHKVTSQFGEPAKAGYMPDSFGHVSQIPQILNGFGIDNFIFMRGIDEKVKKLGLEFLWKGADGESEVLAVNQLYGYGNLMAVGHAIFDEMFQPYECDRAIKKADDLVDGMLERSNSRVFLFNNGHDHKFVQKTLPQAIRDINRHAAGRYRLVHSTHAEFIKDLRSRKPAFKSYQGELRGALEHIILSGVFSARLYLKQANFRCQTLLERYTEPVASVLSLEGYDYPADAILYAWKTLLKNHPHDDICGCSVDEVHRDMVYRFDHVEQVGEVLRDRALDHLLFQVKLPSVEGETPLLVYNTLPWKRTDAIRSIVNMASDDASDEKALHLLDSKGHVVPASFARIEKPFTTDWAFGDQERQKVRVEFLSRDLPPGGFEVYTIRKQPVASGSKKDASEKPTVRTLEKGLENDRIRVKARKNGTLDITDRLTGKLLARTNLFEDVGDRGDEYDFDPVVKDRPVYSTGKGLSWSVVQRNPERLTARLEQIVEIPRQLTPDRQTRAVGTVEIPLRTDVTIYADSARVDLRVSFVNQALDHRLRVGVEVPGSTKSVWVESKFDVLNRSIEASKEEWSQTPKATNAQDGWAALEFERRGVAIFNRGLPEYEVQPWDGSSMFWTTVLRSCGWLSRGDMVSRPYNAGPEIQSPEAQCLGEAHAEIAIYPYRGDWQKAAVPRAAMEYITPATSTSFFHGHRSHRGTHDLPTRHSFYSLESDGIQFSALKQAESGNGLILRLWNPGTRKRQAVVRFDRAIKTAYSTRLDETRLQKLAVDGQTVRVDVTPKKIITLEVTFKKR